MAAVKSISAFFPAYNDEGTIGKMVNDAITVLGKITADFEVIVIDDCSPDRSGEIADALAKKHSFVKVVHHKANRGYGGALKSGFKAASKEWIFYTDGDAQYDVRDLKKLVKEAEREDVDIVNGYKIKRADNIWRIVLGSAYNRFSRIMFGIKIRDIDCDFRLMRKKIFDRVNLENDSGVICVEMIKKIQDAGYVFREVPVRHYPRTSGSSQFFKPVRIARTLGKLAEEWVKLVVLKTHLKCK